MVYAIVAFLILNNGTIKACQIQKWKGPVQSFPWTIVMQMRVKIMLTTA